MSKQTKPADGIYLIYADGHHEAFNGENNKEGIKYIGIIHDGHAFAVTLKDLGRFQLLRDDAECEDESPFYIESECDALNNWEFIERTKRIQELGTDIPLAEGEYLPSLPMLVTMCYLSKRGLNDALIYAGGEPLKPGYYWSATEYGSTNAWFVYFGSGYVYDYHSKATTIVARAVAAFHLCA